jgi:hypothetical protein
VGLNDCEAVLRLEMAITFKVLPLGLVEKGCSRLKPFNDTFETFRAKHSLKTNQGL